MNNECELIELTYHKPYPEIKLEVTSEYIRSEKRKLKAIWTVEAAQDLEQYHGAA